MVWTEADDSRLRQELKGVDVGKLTKCPKCGLGENGSSEMMMANFCTHRHCPFRDWRDAKKEADRAADPYFVALDAWKKDGGARPAKRPDGIPTRIDLQRLSPAEVAIGEAMKAVEAAGASAALTEAVTLLSQARERVADHVENIPPDANWSSQTTYGLTPDGLIGPLTWAALDKASA